MAYLGENPSTELDDELKSEILSGNYTKFSSLAFENPCLPVMHFGISSKRNIKRNVTISFTPARVYKNLNKASLQITKKKI